MTTRTLRITFIAIMIIQIVSNENECIKTGTVTLTPPQCLNDTTITMTCTTHNSDALVWNINKTDYVSFFLNIGDNEIKFNTMNMSCTANKTCVDQTITSYLTCTGLIAFTKPFLVSCTSDDSTTCNTALENFTCSNATPPSSDTPGHSNELDIVTIMLIVLAVFIFIIIIIIIIIVVAIVIQKIMVIRRKKWRPDRKLEVPHMVANNDQIPSTLNSSGSSGDSLQPAESTTPVNEAEVRGATVFPENDDSDRKPSKQNLHRNTSHDEAKDESNTDYNKSKSLRVLQENYERNDCSPPAFLNDRSPFKTVYTQSTSVQYENGTNLVISEQPATLQRLSRPN